LQFRKDINGLRAIAVMAVVLFHFNASWMPGGFVGVDIFFVISGFLMTGIIFSGIEQQNFSILRFYAARANRIIPALAVLCLVLLLFGWFYLTPLEYRALSKHVASSMSFISNITYWGEAGYFDMASDQKWLLHTWSLSAEWQFYLIYPVVLVVMSKFMSLKAMKTTVLVGTVIGFIFSVCVTYQWPTPAYYLLPARAWEMMLGGVAYLYPFKLNDNNKKLLEWIGLALMVAAGLLISEQDLWPGYLAFIPVMGAFLLIQAQRNNSMITGNVILQKLGQWSYSIYLWHWPLVVVIYYYSLDQTTVYLGLVLSVVLGFVSYRTIETLRFKSIPSMGGKDFLTTKPMLLAFSLAGISGFIYLYAYNHTSVSPTVKIREQLVNQEKKLRQVEIRAGICQFNTTGKYKKLNDFINHWDCRSDNEGLVDSGILIFGDSHSADKAMGFRLNGIDVIQIGGAGCPLSPKITRKHKSYCPKLVNLIDSKLSNDDYQTILLSSQFILKDLNDPLYLESVIDFWSKKDKEIIIFSPMPSFKSQFNQYLRFGQTTKKPMLTAHNTFFQRLKSIKIPKNVNIINSYDVWCQKSAPCKVGDDNELLMIDSGHLSALGATYFVKLLLKEPTFNEVVKLN
jgi:peptidoglycan/LPS O-acetylase OafA/YrhL